MTQQHIFKCTMRIWCNRCRIKTRLLHVTPASHHAFLVLTQRTRWPWSRSHAPTRRSSRTRRRGRSSSRARPTASAASSCCSTTSSVNSTAATYRYSCGVTAALNRRRRSVTDDQLTCLYIVYVRFSAPVQCTSEHQIAVD